MNEILKNINKIYIEERENRVTKTILFNLLILTLTLANYLKERKIMQIIIIVMIWNNLF